MQDLLGLGDTTVLKSASGLAGGIGHLGADCGIVTGGALGLCLAGQISQEDDDEATARGSAMARDFMGEFAELNKSTLCKEITQTDFDHIWQVRKFIFLKSGTCKNAASKSLSLLASIVNRNDGESYDLCRDLNRRFADQGFNCAQFVVNTASEKMGLDPVFPSNMLVPFNGGIGYGGSTCSALIGGVLSIGLMRGGDTREGASLFMTLRKVFRLLLEGGAAYDRLYLSPANDALLRSAELAKWFIREFHSMSCRDLIGVDFSNTSQVKEFFGQEFISTCVSRAEKTALKAVALAEEGNALEK